MPPVAHQEHEAGEAVARLVAAVGIVGDHRHVDLRGVAVLGDGRGLDGGDPRPYSSCTAIQSERLVS